MDALRGNHSTSSSLPPGWIASTEERIGAASLATFLTAINRTEIYEQHRLEPVKELSQGTSFKVHACKDVEEGRIVAVKQLHTTEEPSSPGTIPDSILQEMMISVWPLFIEHPNITRTLGCQYFLSDGDGPTINLVLEYSEKGSLGQYLEGGSFNSTTTSDQKRALALDIASGLECLHKSRVIHGDLKPENILLFPRPSLNPRFPLMAKLVDFGNAVIEDVYSKDFRGAKQNLGYYGTPMWVPPIVYELNHQVPFHKMPACDVFSYGLILWSIYKGFKYTRESPAVEDKARCAMTKLEFSALNVAFEQFLSKYAEYSSDKETDILKWAFYKCVEKADWDKSETQNSLHQQGKKPSEELFSLILEVKNILLTNFIEEGE